MNTLIIDTSIPAYSPAEDADWTKSTVVIGGTKEIGGITFSASKTFTLAEIPTELLPALQIGIGFFATQNQDWRVTQCCVNPAYVVPADAPDGAAEQTFTLVLAMIDKDTKQSHANQVVSLEDKPDLLAATKVVWDWSQNLDL